MAVLEKIRVKFGWVISVIIALALLSFIIDPQTVTSALQSMSPKRDVGNIAGKRISFADFDDEFQKYSSLNGSVQSEEQQQQLREQVWQDLIYKYMFNKNAKAAGIYVGEAEMLDLIKGDNISPVIAQNPMFLDENGMFSEEALLAFKDMVAEDNTGMYGTYSNFIQNAVYNQQMQSKYYSLFAATSGLNALELKNAVAENNLSANVDYVLCRYPMQKDTTINVSSDEIRNYYKAHKNFFKQPAESRDIEYVVFEAVPSEADINKVSDAFNAAYEEFATVENMRNFISRNSDSQYTEYWYKAEELSTIATEFVDFAKTAAAGEVSPAIVKGNKFLAAKILAKAQKPDNVTVKITYANGSKEITDELVQNLEIAQPTVLTQANMVAGCEGLFDAPVGQPQMITVQGENYVAKVVEKSEPVEKVQVAVLEKNATVSSETTNIYYAKANEFASLAGKKYEGYQKALDSTKVYSHPLTITEATENFGAIDNAKAVTRWAFDNKVGKVSPIITVGQNYFFVVTVKDVTKEGYTPVEKVAASIESKLYSDKLQVKAKEDLAAQVEGLSTLEEIADKTGGLLESKTDMTFSVMSSAVEPALMGAIIASEDNKIYGPVAGQMGMYFFKVSSRENGTFYTEDDAKNFAAQMAQYNAQAIIPVMMDIADVKDNRARFY